MLSILDEFQQHQSIIVKLAIFGALRREEILGISMDVINTKNNTIHIKRALVYTSEKGLGLELKETKSGGERIITVPKELIEETTAYYKFMLGIRIEICTANTRSNPDKNGEPLQTTLRAKKF